ncbi:MAG: hypothetical protein NTY01_19690 [Verrucomicrobia bacterium]|nr:hypothetical protein [Verrucomicrobiota bacterium]
MIRSAIVVCLCLSVWTASAATAMRWSGGDGNWEDASKWSGPPATVNSFAEINGSSHVILSSGEAAVSRLEVGVNRNSDALLTMNDGSLMALEFIRLGELTGSRGRFVVNGGRVCVTEIGIGGMNEGDGTDRACRGEMEIRGGDVVTRYLALGYGAGSTARLRVVGSKAGSIVALNSIWCSIPSGRVGSTVELAFDIDAKGVTPIVLWNKKDCVRLSRKGRANKCILRVGLLDTPPSGDVVLLAGSKPCEGTFADLPEGSFVRAEHAGRTYEWRLTYRGGASQCDIALCDPHELAADGRKVPHASGKPVRAVKIESAAIKAAWEKMYREVDRCAPPLGSGTRAFPGAEGYGAFAKGGRGGKALFVTNLNNSGPGSLREAINTKGPRTVIFRVGGVIELKKSLQIREPFITIAGQTAPGDGICLKGAADTLTLNNTHDVIVRYLRVRTGHTGDKNENEGDCIACYSARNFILDHCSASWGTDETISCTQTCDRYTVQWCILAEGLSYYGHSMGSILGGDRSSWHHNLYAHCGTRNPRFAGLCRCDFRNNVIYDWGGACGYGDFREVNYVNNFARSGPSTTQKPPLFVLGESVVMPGALFLSGNVMDGSAAVCRDNRTGTGFDLEAFVESPHAVPAVQTQPAEAALDLVLQRAGAILPKRDSTDARIVADVRNRTGRIVRYEKELGPWPAYAGGQAPPDSDNDGIPDDWEKAHGLNPADPTDASQVAADGYTKLEHYLNSLVPPKSD